MKSITLHEAKNIALGALHKAEAQREKGRVAEAKYWQSLESSVRLTTLQRGLAVSLLFNVVLLALLLISISGR